MIDIETFSSVEMVVGSILSAKEVSSSDTLFHLMVAIGESEPRSIVSGIREHFSAEELEGKRCVIVSNLAPRTLFGIESNGMLLCASFRDSEGAHHVSLVSAPELVPIGTRLS